jgi:hypothetical protein
VGITGNENADTTTKEVLHEQIQSFEKYPPQDLTNWIEWKQQEEQQEKWKNTTTEMKERNLHIRINRDTQTMRNQVIISQLRTGYCRATHAAVMNREPRLECPFCGVKVPLTIDHNRPQNPKRI